MAAAGELSAACRVVTPSRGARIGVKRRHQTAGRAFALAFALAAAFLLACPAGASAAGPLWTALAEHEEFSDPSLTNTELDRIHGSGATFFRASLDWYSVVPAEKPARWDPTNPNDPNYNWSGFDRKVNALKAHGLEPIVSVDYPPVWAGGGPSPRPDVAAFGQFARAAARRYDGRTPGVPRVRYWQVWIEPNVNLFLSPQFAGGKPYSPLLYRRMVNAMADGVHAARADNLVIAGGLSPFTINRGATLTVGPLRFMRAMLCMSKGKPPRATCAERSRFDIWSHHPYTSGGPTHKAYNPDDVSLGDLPEMRQLLRAAVKARHVISRTAVRFWVTEFSWDTNPPDKYALPIGLQARWTSEALYRMWLNGVSLVTWLALRDSPYPSEPVQSGLYFRGSSLARDRAKPTLTAFKFPFVAFRSKTRASVWGRTPWGRPAAVTVEQRTATGWRTAARLRTDRYGIFRARVKLRGGRPLRAKLGSSASLPFSLKRVPDRFVYPFGCGVCRP